MGEIAVFVPGNCERSAATLCRLGLSGLLDARVTVSCTDEEGPTKTRGVMFRFAHDNEPEYRTPRVTASDRWIELSKDGDLAEGRAWIGWSEASPPTPADLMRARQRDGEAVELCNGNTWHVPIARQLPCVLARGDDGKPVKRPVERYRAFYQSACKALDWFEPKGDTNSVHVDTEEGLRFCVDALAINYRITPDLALALEFIATDDIWTIARAVCQYDLMAAMAVLLSSPQKKTELDSTFDSQPTGVGVSA